MYKYHFYSVVQESSLLINKTSRELTVNTPEAKLGIWDNNL